MITILLFILAFLTGCAFGYNINRINSLDKQLNLLIKIKDKIILKKNKISFLNANYE